MAKQYKNYDEDFKKTIVNLYESGKSIADLSREYDKFKMKQDRLYKSDFDNFINETRMIENGSDNCGK